MVGNPNAGKTTLFNALTGLRHRVGNYPGVTVEKKEADLALPDGTSVHLLDLPGIYSLNPVSPDERITTEILLGTSELEPLPDVVLCVVDASNLERHLYLASQVIDREVPVVVALTMSDLAEQEGIHVDRAALSRALGVPVVRTVAGTGDGVEELRRLFASPPPPSPQVRRWTLPEAVHRETEELAELLRTRRGMPGGLAWHEAAALLSSPDAGGSRGRDFPAELLEHVRKDHQKLEFLGFDRSAVFVEARYAWLRGVCGAAVRREHSGRRSLNDRLDTLLTHRVWGMAIFALLMAFVFQSIFLWAQGPMDLIGAGFDRLGMFVTGVMPPGDLRDLLVDGAIAGVAAVVTFLPQILLLFLFLGLLEDSGYMARAALMMDRLMSKVGLNGKSFIPLLSSFACAIPGIMATRTIENSRDRLLTMLVAPLMSCSARLPVYTLMIAAFIPDTPVLGPLGLPALTMLAMYLLGVAAALGMAWFLRMTILRGPAPAFIIELPPYKAPVLRSVLIQMWERGLVFLKSAGTIILGVSIVLWFLGTYPRTEGTDPSTRLRESFAGQAGRFIEPLIAPLGFDWRIGIGLVGSILQREVFVSTMGTIYNIQDGEDTGGVSLQEKLRNDRNPATGAPSFTALTAICVMVYYVLAMQCLSTVAVVRRETNGWKWPLFQFGYMTVLAWVVTFVVYRAGLALGWGGG
jgi:ferrous iron transport protein B